MKLTDKEKKILESGTMIQKQNLGISHYGDDEWMKEALDFIDKEGLGKLS